MRTAVYGKDVRESIAKSMEETGSIADETKARQGELESQFQSVLDETTGKDVISAPEILAAKVGADGKNHSNLKQRLDSEHNDVTQKLAHIAQLIDKSKTRSEIQTVFDNLVDGTTVKFPRSIYNFDNVLVLQGKNNIDLDLKDATFSIDKHGFGILELDNCKNVNITGGKLLGYGNFPSQTIDTIAKTLQNEKHDTINVWGFHRNGDANADINSHAYGGGTYGNLGIGILIRNGCENILVDGVEVSGFNGYGISIGFLGDGNQQTTPQNYSKNVKVQNCYVHDIFDTGINVMAVDGFDITNNNRIEDCGHPSATTNDIIIDPGYGISMRGAWSYAKNGSIIKNSIKRCKRKGIDSHAHNNVKIKDNDVEDCYNYGIAATPSGGYPLIDTMIDDNRVRNCGNSLADEGNVAIYSASSGINEITKNKIYDSCKLNSSRNNAIIVNTSLDLSLIHDNLIMNSGAAKAIGVNKTPASFKGNTIIHTFDNPYTSPVGIDYDGVDHAESNAIVTENTILMNKGKNIRVVNTKKGKLANLTLKAPVEHIELNRSNIIMDINSIITQGSQFQYLSNNWEIRLPKTYVVQVTNNAGVLSYINVIGDFASAITDDVRGFKLTPNYQFKAISVSHVDTSGAGNSLIKNIYMRNYVPTDLVFGLQDATGADKALSSLTGYTVRLTIVVV